LDGRLDDGLSVKGTKAEFLDPTDHKPGRKGSMSNSSCEHLLTGFDLGIFRKKIHLEQTLGGFFLNAETANNALLPRSIDLAADAAGFIG
jgi:hypothetical protein